MSVTRLGSLQTESRGFRGQTSPGWGPGDYLPVSTGCLKKACWAVASRREGPSAGHSLVTLVSVLPLSSKWAIKKPKHNDLLWTEITVNVVSRSCC